MRVLFVCGRARLRSPTAVQIFSGCAGLEVACAGLSADADEPVTAEQLAWADIVFVMERSQRTRLQRRFRPALKHLRVICLDLRDQYGFMDPVPVQLLRTRVQPHLKWHRPTPSLPPGTRGRPQRDQ